MANGQWKNRIVGSDEVAPDDLLANPLNWRVHPKHQQDALRGVIDEVGFVSPVLVQAGTDVVVDGHMRVTLALRDNIATIPVIYLDLDDNEVNTILATFDPLSALAATDAAQLDALLREVSTSDAAVMQMLADLAEEAGVVSFDGENDGMTDADDVPEPPVDPITRPGDLWTLGRHRLLCGDSTNRADVDRLMQGERADMVFTDPPYGVDYDGGSGNERKREKLRGDAQGVYADWLRNVDAFATDSTPFYIWFAGKHGARVFESVEGAGLTVRALIVWNKLNAHYGAYMSQYMPKHEPCLYCHIGSPRWYGPTNEVSVWDIEQPSRNEFHPTQKPTDLARRAMTNSSRPGDVVLDLFLGSGSTLIAAEEIGRVCYGIELDPIYCDVIVRRWQNFTGETASREAAG